MPIPPVMASCRSICNRDIDILILFREYSLVDGLTGGMLRVEGVEMRWSSELNHSRPKPTPRLGRR